MIAIRLCADSTRTATTAHCGNPATIHGANPTRMMRATVNALNLLDRSPIDTCGIVPESQRNHATTQFPCSGGGPTFAVRVSQVNWYDELETVTMRPHQISPHRESRTAGANTPLAAVILAVLSLTSLSGFTYLGREVGEPITTVTDSQLLAAVAGWTRLWPLTLAETVTFFGAAPSIIAITVMLLALLTRQRRWFDVAYVVIADVGAIMLSTWTKDLVARIRPTAFFRVTAAGYSFPSGHTLNATSLALVMGFILWRTHWRRATKVAGTVALVLYVVCVGTSRIVLGVHYPTDVLAGFLLALAWGTLLMIVVLIREWQATQRLAHARIPSYVPPAD